MSQPSFSTSWTLWLSSALLIAIAAWTGAATTSSTDVIARRLHDVLAGADSVGVIQLAYDLVQALERDHEAEPDTLVARLDRLRDDLLSVDRFDLARVAATRGLEIRLGQPGIDRLTLADAHTWVMYCAYQLDDLSAAWEHQSEVVRLHSAATPPDDLRLADSLSDLFFIAYARGDYAAAISAGREALELHLSRPEPSHRDIVEFQANLAEMHRLEGDFGATESLLVASIERSAANLPADTPYAKLLNNLGAFYWDEGRLDDAERLYKEALEIKEADPERDARGIALAYQNLGVLKREQFQPARAETLLTRALHLARAVHPPDDPDLAYFPLELGALYAETDRWADAIPLWEEALAALEASPTPNLVFEAKVLHDMGTAHLRAGELTASRELLEAALSRRRDAHGPHHPDVGVTMVSLARTRHEMGDPEVDVLLDSAISILEGHLLARDERALGLALRAERAWARTDRKVALHDLQMALDTIEQLRPHQGSADLTRARFMERFLPLHQRMIGWQVDMGELEAALMTAERARARVLQDRLQAAGVDLRADMDPVVRAHLEERERDARIRIGEIQRQLRWERSRWQADDPEAEARLSELEDDLESAVDEFGEVTDEIRLHSPAWRSLQERRQDPVSVAKSQHYLDGTAEQLWIYQIGEARSFLFVISPPPRSVHCFELTLTDRELDRAMRRIARDLTDRTGAGLFVAGRGVTGMARVSGDDQSDDPEPGELSSLHALWQRLVPPAAWKLAVDASVITVIPDASLHVLPFEALVVAERARPEGPTCWLDTGPVVRYALSLNSLSTLSDRQRPPQHIDNQRVVSVSNPIFDPVTVSNLGRPESMNGPTQRLAPEKTTSTLDRMMPPLPGTQHETRALVDAFGAEHVRVLEGVEATESALKASAPRSSLLHLATHGIVEEAGHDLLAALVFTPPDEASPSATTSADDGFLHLFEIYELELACDLAVLSACETNLGAAVRGEGVFALSRGFLEAGADRTVASLWSVDDESTATLMETFFENLATDRRAGGGVDYARILRDAKRAVRADPRWSAPYFWAPFVLTGIR